MSVFERLNGIPPSKLEMKRRLEQVKGIIIHHPKYEKMLEQLEETLVLSEGTVSPDSLFIYGPTGVGKSTVTKEFRDRHPRIEVITETRKYIHIPVLHVVVPPKATPKSLASKILYSMGDELHHKGTESQLTSRIHHYIDVLEIKMVVLDEFQHLIDSETDHVLTTASNWVKTFTEESAIPIVLCGMPQSVSIFAKNEQLDRRYCNKEPMNAFEYDLKEEIIDFRVFLKKVEGELPFSDPSNLADSSIADKLYYISMGIPFYVMKLLEFATVMAVKQGEDCILEDHLKSALTKIKQVSRPFKVNPFCKEDFVLSDYRDKEQAAENRYKEQLLGEKQRRRKNSKI